MMTIVPTPRRYQPKITRLISSLFIFSIVFLSWVPDSGVAQERLPVIAHMFPKDSPPDLAAQAFEQALKATGLTDVSVVPAALLGDEQKNFHDLAADKLSFAITGDLLISGIAPEFAPANLPFAYRSLDHALEPFRDGPVLEKFRTQLSALGIRHLGTLCLGTRYLTSNRPVRSLDDLKGLKLRLPNDRVWSLMWQALGVEVRNVPFTELPVSLQNGLVDAQENPPSLIRKANLYKSQKYLIATRHYYQRQFILASERFFAESDTKTQSQIMQAAEQAATASCETVRSAEKADIEWLTGEGGMELITLDLSGADDQLKTVYNENFKADANADLVKIMGLN